MTQYEMLMAYQTEDMKADRIEQEIRRSPNRQTLEKDRGFILKQQELFKALDAKLAQISDRREMIDEALPRYARQLEALTQRAEQDPPADIEGVQALIMELETCRASIADYEAELKKMAKDTTEAMNQQRHIKKQAGTVKQEFDALKVVYEKELAEQKARLKDQKAAAAAKAAGIDESLMATYIAIKKRVVPPITKLIGNQCSGCNTGLPGAMLSKIRDGHPVECETCGRLIVHIAE